MVDDKQMRCIEMMLDDVKQCVIAKELKVTDTTISNWKRNVEFQAEFRRQTFLKIGKYIPKATSKLGELLDSANENIVLNAIKEVYDRAGIKQIDKSEITQTTIDVTADAKAKYVADKLAEIIKNNTKVKTDANDVSCDTDFSRHKIDSPTQRL